MFHIGRRFPNWAPRIYQNTIFSFSWCVLFFQTATKLFGQIVIKLFGQIVIKLFGQIVIKLFGQIVIKLLGQIVIKLFGQIVIKLFGQIVIKLFGQIVIKLFGPNCLINGSISYFSWPRGAVKTLLGHWGRRKARKFGKSWCRVRPCAVDGNELLPSVTHQCVKYRRKSNWNEVL